MNGRYKLLISNKNLYKEIEIAPEDTYISIGTSPENTVRLRKELFFVPIELVLEKVNEAWIITCSDNLYFTLGDVRRLLTKELVHGDEFIVKYEESNNDVFNVSFLIDFDFDRKDYNLEITLPTSGMVNVGGTPNCSLQVSSEHLGTDSFTLYVENGCRFARDNNSRYGLYINGAKISGNKELHDCDFVSIVDFSFYYKNGKLYSPMYESLKINGLTYRRVNEQSTHFEYPKFSRNTRVQYKIPEDELKIQQAAQKPQKPKTNLIMSLIPAIVMLGLTIVLRGFMGNGGTFVIYSAATMSVGIIMSIVSAIVDKKTYKKDFAKRIEDYNKYIDEKRVIIEESRQNEIRIRNLIYESLEHSINEANLFGKRLFEREVKHPDFLQIYLGKGTVESANQVEYPEQEFIDTEDPLCTVPKEVSDEYKFIQNAPIISDFNQSCGIGIVGNKEYLQSMMKNITLDIGIRHFFNEVKLVYILSPGYTEKMEWVRWLRNVENVKSGIRNIAIDEESKNVVLEDLYAILSSREESRKEEKGEDFAFPEQYVVFVTDAASIAKHPISKYFKNCVDYGFTFVFIEEYEEFIPQGCAEIIHVTDMNHGYFVHTDNGDNVSNFEFPTVPDQIAEDVAFKLGAVAVDEVSLEGELTKNITMFELLGIIAVEDLNLEERWGSSIVYKSLAAPLGVRNKGQVVYLDISDKANAHGPHGLVAGTTGSGKSEILQTYILSLATLFHPYEVGFVIIDFKGGGMANQFVDLPHLIGTITNIDGREINRSLLSIKAELIKRQELFSQSGVNHINDYIKLYKAGQVSVPMPHLIMIVDEFAELKAEYPDFMKELISAARIGRTLGVHLILATQKPAGVVDAQIWSNSKFKLCLKVQTKEDSNEVLKTPLAAEIVEPGRAYFQVGNNEVFELFQSAYSGANVPEGDETQDRIYAIYEKNLWGKRKLVYTNKKAKTSDSSISQLDAIVNYVHAYCTEKGIKQLPGICLPSLENKITTDSLKYGDTDSLSVKVPIGLFDDPEFQRQGEVVLDLARDNSYIVGSSQSGKTVMLQTIAYGLIRNYSPSEVNIYFIDCGSMVLKIFEDSKHVGGVVLSNEEEKCKNLFKLLNTFVGQRKKILSGKGVGNYAAYKEAGFKDMPLIVVMIDNMAAFKEYFPDQADEIIGLSREAMGVGISFIITAAQSNALNYRTQANFGFKCVLNCNDPNEYSNVFGHCKETPKENPGCGFFMLEKRILEFQTAIFGKGEKEAERSQAIIEYINNRNGEFSTKAIHIPMVPERLILSDVISERPELFRTKGIIPIGMDFNSVEFANVNMISGGFLALLGDQENKDRFIKCFLGTIARNIVFHNVNAVIIDDKNKRLKEYGEIGFVSDYSADSAESLLLVNDFCTKVVTDSESDTSEAEGTINLIVINSIDVLRRIFADMRDNKALVEAIRVAKGTNCFFLLSAIENQAIGFNSSDVLKFVKEERQAIFFGQLPDNKLFEVSGRPKNDTSFDTTMGYRFDGNATYKIKIFE